MSVYSVYVISESGSLKFHYDHNLPIIEPEKTFSYPLQFVFKQLNDQIVVDFGEHDGIRIGHAVLAINGIGSGSNGTLTDGRKIMDVLNNEANFPLSIKFGNPRLKVNDRIMLASMFQPLHQMSRVLSPAGKSSGIQTLETDSFKVHCSEVLTGIKFLVVTDTKLSGVDLCLRKLYEAYCDYVLKNPFYSHDLPIRYPHFDQQVKFICDNIERGNLAAL